MQRRQVWGLVAALVAIAIPTTWWGRQQIAQRAFQQSTVGFPFPQPSAADAAPIALSPADEAAIAGVIQQQIDAFQDDDAESAFSFASPDVREQFETADQFMAMVRSAYEPVYRPQSVNFGDIEWVRGQPIQAVTVMAPTGAWLTAYYQMEQQADNTWRIAGCVLVPLKGETI